MTPANLCQTNQSHTILGSKTQRGLTQLSLDLIFRSLGAQVLDCSSHPTLEHTISASDSSEATVFSASSFLETVYAETAPPRPGSRAPTPLLVRLAPPVSPFESAPDGEDCPVVSTSPTSSFYTAQEDLNALVDSPKTVRIVSREDSVMPSSPPFLFRAPAHGALADRANAFPRSKAQSSIPIARAMHRGNKSPVKHFMSSTASIRSKTATKPVTKLQGESQYGSNPNASRRLQRPSVFPQQPDISAFSVSCDPSAEYAVVVSMYEVYNDRIFDLLTPPVKSAATKEYRRRPLLFKPTETSPDRKVVAGLRKVVCGGLNQALMVLEAGLHERRVTGTGSNSVSSRSHGFFCVEVRKRPRGNRRHGLEMPWTGSTLTVVDLAGSERARDAKTAGATLAEAGKINESLMYLGQCLQMQSDAGSKDRVR